MPPEPQQRQALHVLTGRSDQTPTTLGRSDRVARGDLVADLRRFPPTLYEMGGEGRGVVEVDDEALARRDYWSVAHRWLEDLTRQTGLQDQLSVEGYGFWWTLNGQKFVAGLTDLGNTFAWIDLLEGLRAKTHFQEIHVYGQHPTAARLVTQAWPEAELHIEPGAGAGARREGRPAPIARQLSSAFLLLARLLLSALYLAYSLLRRPQICALSDTNLLRTSAAGGQERLRDIYLGDVVDRLRERGWRVALVEKFGANASWSGLADRGFYFPSDLIFVLSAPVLGRLGFYPRLRVRWAGKWKQFEPDLAERLKYRGYDLSSQLLPLIRHEFLVHGPDLEIMVALWRHLLKLWKPHLLYVNNSYGRGAFPAIVAAKLADIPSVEQQHGLIGRNHIAYLLPADLARQARRPLCDVMAVWGAHTRRFLLDAGVYEPDQMAICGFPRIDALLRDLPPVEETRTKLDLPPQDTVVLYTSNGFAQDMMPDILDGIRATPAQSRIHWLIKLHPREKTRPQWEAAIRQRGLDRVRVLEGEFDFYALLAACDLHVSFASTTLIEAAVLGKPNLGLDVARVSDPAGYAQAGAFLPVRPAELGPVAHQILTSPERRKQLLDEQKAFAQAWCVHDGTAVDCIVGLLESVAQKVQKGKEPGHVTA